MANIRRTSNGVWSDANWAPQAPISTDDVYANGFTTSLDVDVNVLSLRTTAATGISAGGGFTVAAGSTIQADIYAGPTPGVNFSITATKTFIGNVTGGAASQASGIHFTAAAGATLNITGNLLGGTSNACPAIWAYNGQVILTGTGVGGSSSNCPAIYVGLNPGSGGTIVGTIFQGGTGSPGILTQGGSITADTIISSSNNVTGVQMGTSGSLTVRSMIFTNGYNAFTSVSGVAVRFANSGTLNVTALRLNGSSVSLSDAGAGQAAITNVRNGIVYANGSLTGTAHIPPAASVALNVPVDNTVGSMTTTAVVIDGTLQTRLENCATVSTVNAAIASINILP